MLQVLLHAAAHEVRHLIFEKSGPFSIGHLNLLTGVLASQENAKRSGLFHLKSFAYESPSFLKVLLWASQLKVVDVDHQVKLELSMKVARVPNLGNGLEAHGTQMSIAMTLPVRP